MSIPESQLEIWTNQGSVTNSASTHTVLRNKLAAYNWSGRFKYDDYLQGSYANTTNIRGESDVDIVIECNSFYYCDLTDAESEQLGLGTGIGTLSEFRTEVIKALNACYGEKYIDTSGANSIKILPSDTSNRLYADVVVCVSYKRYHNLKVIAEGITFWNQKNNIQITNYPKLHKSNGWTKNANCNDNYKPIVRMVKNARRCMIEGDAELRKRFSSYSVECLLYNVPNSYYHGSTWQGIFLNILGYLTNVFEQDAVGGFVTQSEQHILIGDHPVQFSKANAREFVTRLTKLWQEYYA